MSGRLCLLADTMESRLVLLLLCGLVHHQVEGLELRCSQHPIVTHVGSRVVLECQALPIMDVRGKEIRWTKDKALVHLYRFGQDENEQQHPRFRGRTQLFESQFHVGNVSLMLRDVNLSDRGTYNCFVEVLPEANHDSDVNLNVLSIGLLPSINLDHYTKNGIQLTCSSQRWFPEPVVEWKDQHEQSLTQKSKTITVQNTKGFYSVRSIIEVTEATGNNYNCLMRSKEINLPLSAVFGVPDEFFPRTSMWLPAFLLIFFALIFIIIGLLLFFRKLRVRIKDLQKRPTVIEYSMLVSRKQTLEQKLGEHHDNLAKIRILPQTAVERITCVAASVTLDGDTAHPNLKISPNLTTVSCVVERVVPAENSKRFDSMLAVMGRKGFSSGRHFWVVEVESNSEWDLGVASDEVVRRGETPLNPDHGFWTIGCHAKDFQVNGVEVSEISIKPEIKAKIKMIGIYVNYSEGKVLFYDAETHSHLHTFQNSHFEGAIFPFFKLTKTGQILKIR